MSVADIKETIQKLSPEERGEISNFISRLRVAEDPDYWSRIRRRMADENRENWVPLEEIVSQEG